MPIQTFYKTTDGITFTEKELAERHQRTLDKQKEEVYYFINPANLSIEKIYALKSRNDSKWIDAKFCFNDYSFSVSTDSICIILSEEQYSDNVMQINVALQALKDLNKTYPMSDLAKKLLDKIRKER